MKRLFVVIVLGLAACGGGHAATTATTRAPITSVTTLAPTTTTVAPTTTVPPTTVPPTTVAPTDPPTSDPPPPPPTEAPAPPAPIVLPNGSAGPTYSPGAVLDVTVVQICTSGYASSVRNVSTAEKNQVYAEYGITNHTGYVIDHLVSLELGGSNDISNLWPETTAEAKRKDVVENQLHDAVCNGSMSLADAQAQIATWWTAPSYSTAPTPAPVAPQPAPTPAPAPRTPATTAAAPSGGGFTCADGTHSDAAHRQGACSHHGGVVG